MKQTSERKELKDFFGEDYNPEYFKKYKKDLESKSFADIEEVKKYFVELGTNWEETNRIRKKLIEDVSKHFSIVKELDPAASRAAVEEILADTGNKKPIGFNEFIDIAEKYAPQQAKIMQKIMSIESREKANLLLMKELSRSLAEQVALREEMEGLKKFVAHQKQVLHKSLQVLQEEAFELRQQIATNKPTLSNLIKHSILSIINYFK